MENNFKITKPEANRINLELNGKLDASAMKTVLDELGELSRGVENGKMLYRITDFKFPTFGALAVEFSRLPSLFKLIAQFDRAAVIAGDDWIRKASELEGKLFPGLEIKAFRPGDDDAAEEWLNSSEEA